MRSSAASDRWEEGRREFCPGDTGRMLLQRIKSAGSSSRRRGKRPHDPWGHSAYRSTRRRVGKMVVRRVTRIVPSTSFLRVRGKGVFQRFAPRDGGDTITQQLLRIVPGGTTLRLWARREESAVKRRKRGKGSRPGSREGAV